MNDPASVKIFIRNWSVYQKVVAANYMQHARFGALTLAALQREANEGTPNLLDLGCGDAGWMAAHLSQIRVSHYSGYDLSPIALQYANRNLSFLGDKVTFEEGPMEEILPVEKRKFEIVHSSFAIHHLSDHRKIDFFKQVAGRLIKQGLFIYVDTYRLPGTDRETCLNSYISWMMENWEHITEEEKERIADHVISFDHPATLPYIEEIAANAGLYPVEKVTDDPRHFYMSFRKL